MNVNITVNQILASSKPTNRIGETFSNAKPLVLAESEEALLGELSRLAFTKSYLVACSVLADLNVYIKTGMGHSLSIYAESSEKLTFLTP